MTGLDGSTRRTKWAFRNEERKALIGFTDRYQVATAIMQLCIYVPYAAGVVGGDGVRVWNVVSQGRFEILIRNMMGSIRPPRTLWNFIVGRRISFK
jgi:hypothetical protein